MYRAILNLFYKPITARWSIKLLQQQDLDQFITVLSAVMTVILSLVYILFHVTVAILNITGRLVDLFLKDSVSTKLLFVIKIGIILLIDMFIQKSITLIGTPRKLFFLLLTIMTGQWLNLRVSLQMKISITKIALLPSTTCLPNLF